MKRPAHIEGLRILTKSRVDFVVVGALGVDHYAQDVSDAILTADCDVLLKPTQANLARALRALEAEGWELEGGGEPLGTLDAALFRGLLRHRGLVRARGEGLPLDLMLEAQPYPYGEWQRASGLFEASGTKVRVGALAMLLEAKRRADRPKDRAFLAQWKALHPPKKKRP